MFKTIIYVAIGGAIGSVLRLLISIIINKYLSNSFPFATLLVNVLGCFLIGILVGIFDKNNVIDTSLKYLLITGFCGGFTTFSAFGLENVSLFQNQNPFYALLYIGLSVVLGLAAVWFGLFITK
ncbi:MAG: CrcB protein [Flavobacterium sp.]|jgi:CrcB protein